MQCFLHISLSVGIATWFGVLASIHHSSVCRSNWKQMTQVVVVTHILCFFQFCGFALYLSCVDMSWNTTSLSVVMHINCQAMHCLLLILIFPVAVLSSLVPGQMHCRYSRGKHFLLNYFSKWKPFFYSGWRLCLGCKPERFKHLLFLLLFKPVQHILSERAVCQVIRNHYFATELLNGCENRCLSDFYLLDWIFLMFGNFYLQSAIVLSIEGLIQIIWAIREQRCGSVIHNWNLAFRLTSLVCCRTRTGC